MASITFALDDKLKSEISKLNWIIWSELVKQELQGRQKVLIQDERAKLFEELEELTKNSKLTDKDCLRFAKLVKERLSKESGE